MATAIETNRPPNASFCCCGDAGEPDVDARTGSGRRRRARRSPSGRATLTAPVSTSAISARDRGGRRAVDAGDRPLGVDLLDGRDLAQRDLDHGADGQRASVSTDVTGRGRGGRRSRSCRPRRAAGPGSPSVPTSAPRTSWATWAVVRPTRIDLFGIGRDADLRRALRQVGLEVEEVAVVGQRREDGVVGLLDRSPGRRPRR